MNTQTDSPKPKTMTLTAIIEDLKIRRDKCGEAARETGKFYAYNYAIEQLEKLVKENTTVTTFATLDLTEGQPIRKIRKQEYKLTLIETKEVEI